MFGVVLILFVIIIFQDMELEELRVELEYTRKELEWYVTSNMGVIKNAQHLIQRLRAEIRELRKLCG